MSNLDQTPSSLAQRLAKDGFRGTPIAIAIAELVGSYLGAGNVHGKLLGKLQGTNTAVGDIMMDQPTSSTSRNPSIETMPPMVNEEKIAA